MMNLSDRLADSIKNRLMAPEGFAEDHVIGGQTVSCVLSAPEAIPSDQPGVYLTRVILHVLAEMMAPPEPGQRLVVDGKGWTVNSVEIFKGIIRVELYQSGA